MSDITVSFGAKDEGLKGAITGAQKGIAGLGKAFAGLAAAAGIGAGVKMAFDAFKGMADYAGGIADVKAQTGLATEETMVWSQALKNAGVGADQLGSIMNRVQKAMTGVNDEGEPTNKAFQRMGINLEYLRSLSPDQQLNAVQEAIASISDPAERASTAMMLLGKSGGKALSLFTDSKALTTAREQLGDLANTLGGNIESLDKLSDALNAAGEIKSLQFMAGFASGFSGDMNAAADAINRIDFSKDGEDLGLMARGAKDLADELQRAAGIKPTGGGTLFDALNMAMGFGAILGPLKRKGQGANIASDLDQSLGNPDFWKNLGQNGEKGTEENTTGVLMSQMNAAKEALGSSLDLMTDLTGLSASNLSLQDSYSSALSGATEQMSVMVDSQNALNDAKEKEAEVARKSADIEKEKLQNLKSQTSERLSAAQSQLERLSQAKPGIGKYGSRASAARKALELENKAQLAEDMGNTEKAGILRRQAAQKRARAFGGKDDKVGTAEQSLKSIDSRLEELNKKLPTPALAP